jgi:hypothetical protein
MKTVDRNKKAAQERRFLFSQSIENHQFNQSLINR